jgi:hypothetical protein
MTEQEGFLTDPGLFGDLQVFFTLRLARRRARERF